MSRVWYYVFVTCLDQVLPLFSWPHRRQLDRGICFTLPASRPVPSVWEIHAVPSLP